MFRSKDVDVARLERRFELWKINKKRSDEQIYLVSQGGGEWWNRRAGKKAYHFRAQWDGSDWPVELHPLIVGMNPRFDGGYEQIRADYDVHDECDFYAHGCGDAYRPRIRDLEASHDNATEPP